MEGKKKDGSIRVLLVDDSPLVLAILKRMLSTAADIEVAGVAKNGREALELIPSLDPAVICTDLHMPVMDGLEFTKEVMDRFPRPILVVSVSVEKGSENVFKLLEAGAVDIFVKPRAETDAGYHERASEFMRMVRILSGVHVFRRPRKVTKGGALRDAPNGGRPRMLAIGASTGGPQALQSILSTLSPAFPAPVVCVQHIGEGFLDGLVRWLGSVCRIRVRTASDGDSPEAGVVYFPREGSHLALDASGLFRHSLEEPLGGHRPSITFTFRSLAAHYRSSLVGVLLTGMGTDGADGLYAIKGSGGRTIAQDEATSVVFSMPGRAIELGAADEVLPLDGIAASIQKKFS